MTRQTATTFVRITTILVLLIQSGLSMFGAFRSTTESTLGSILSWVWAIEAMAAVLLLFRATVLIGGISLLIIFALLLVVLGPADQLSLLVYAAVVVMIMTDRDQSDGRRVPETSGSSGDQV